MTGLLYVGIIGTAIVLVAALVNLVVVRADSPRYRLESVGTYNGGAEVKKLVKDPSRINSLLVFGASLQLVAVIWQAASS